LRSFTARRMSWFVRSCSSLSTRDRAASFATWEKETDSTRARERARARESESE